MEESYSIALTSKRIRELEEGNIRTIAHTRGISEEEALFSLMKSQPCMFGAMSDWDDIRSISLAVMHELRPYQSSQDIYVFVMRVVNLYDTQIISVLRTFSDVRRLAYFVHEMIEGLLEIPLYQTNLAKEYGVSPDDKIILRGIVLNRITSPEVRKLFQDDRSRYFRAESFCAMEALQHHRERQLAASV